MNTDYLYPQIADRQSIEEWEENGKLDMRTRAIARTKELLSASPPGHIDPAIDASIRASHNICLAL